MIIKNNPKFGKQGNNNCNEKNVWIQFINELEWVETTNLNMCCKYYWEYNLHCLLVGRQQFWIEFVPTIWWRFQGQCFFWKQKHMKNIVINLFLFESVVFCRCQKFETRNIVFHDLHF
jgi:hypothetical protein